jgi:O-acetyl-ADP-ribose deacetylase (regulator of RNase III)
MQPSDYRIPGLLKYKIGDATVPEAAGMRYIIHVCNVIGAWGAGFVLAVSKRWKKPEEEYRKLWRSGLIKLGDIQIVSVQSDTAIINMFAQKQLGLDEDGQIPLDYAALELCLDKVGIAAANDGASVCGPKFGTGLAFGDWSKIEPMIVEKIIKRGINVTIYDLPK